MHGFGIVGTGMISNFHANAIAEIDGAELIGCYNRTPEKAAKFVAEHGGEAFASLEALLADDRITAVCINTPSGARRDIAVAAAEAGKHVVVEKPLEVTLARCDAIIDACDKAGVKLCTIMQSRFSAANVALKKAVDDGRFGRLTLGDTYVKWWRSQEYYDSGGWRGTYELDGGGAFMNQAIHNVDLLLWFMGDVTEVSAVTGTLAHERIEVEDTAVAAVRFANGALGTLEASTAAWPGLLKKTELHGTTGSAIVEQDSLLLWKFAEETDADAAIRKQFAAPDTIGGGAADPKAISHAGHRDQLKDFLHAIDTGGEPLVDGREGRKSVELILAIYESQRTGKRVELPLQQDPPRPNA
ncbi:Gfo/Idh/MocA family protein [Alienimonas californiensis]|uniref:1,5-anhydro-D-fructose reductase n=1 Tax=Alienimonas californiensis TaxID=2527989 RepID=A0A517PEM0_9PLAN|nr:Gfo/Idh/MocA family oxidoreductase [Alienimonas californiensis]QDT17830.1 1,5-anhydro-D-fructose reductase [Alienimonas californiensis]